MTIFCEKTSPPFSVVLPVSVLSLILEHKFTVCQRDSVGVYKPVQGKYLRTFAHYLMKTSSPNIVHKL
jgi:hypothetical protein